MKKRFLSLAMALLTACSALTLAPANAAPVGTGYSEEVYDNLAGAAGYLRVTPEYLQQFGVASIHFFLGISGKLGQFQYDYSREIATNGPRNLYSDYTGASLNDINVVMQHYNVNPSQAQYLGGYLMTFLAQLDARNKGVNFDSFRPSRTTTTTAPTTTAAPTTTTSTTTTVAPGLTWAQWNTAYGAGLKTYAAPSGTGTIRTPVCFGLDAASASFLSTINTAIANVPTAASTKRTDVLALLNAAKTATESFRSACTAGGWIAWDGQARGWDAANYAAAAANVAADEPVIETQAGNPSAGPVTVTPSVVIDWKTYWMSLLDNAIAGAGSPCADFAGVKGQVTGIIYSSGTPLATPIYAASLRTGTAGANLANWAAQSDCAAAQADVANGGTLLARLQAFKTAALALG